MIDARPRAVASALVLLVAMATSGTTVMAEEATFFDQEAPAYVVAGTDGAGLPLRSGPGPEHTVLGSLPEGSGVRLVNGPLPGSDGLMNWYQVELGGAGTMSGFANGRFLVKVGGAIAGGPNTPTTLVLPPDSRVYSNAIVTGYANGSDGGAVGSITASGTRTRWGVVAADRSLFPFGTKLLIEGFDDTVFVVEDTGSGVKGIFFDVWFPDVPTAVRFGTQRRTVTVLPPGS